MEVFKDNRIVLTLDAGGTNFVFSALRGGREIRTVSKPSYGDKLDLSLNTIIEGFFEVKSKIIEDPVAISFAFPGPADYPNGIIGDLENLPSYRGGIALGPMLQEIFNIPVWINNDGDLFAYGEAIGGILAEINKTLSSHNSSKEYKNLLGVTIGTGFGGGIVINNQLCRGDNSAAGEIWLTRNYLNPLTFAEEGVSARAIKHYYLDVSQEENSTLTSEDIYEIAIGEKKGNQQAALKAFEYIGKNLGDSLADAINLIDGIIVIGGGISGAYELFIPTVIEQLSGSINKSSGGHIRRIISKLYNVENPESRKEFYEDGSVEVKIPFTDKMTRYNPVKKIAIGVSRIGTNRAIALGAYAFAINQIK